MLGVYFLWGTSEILRGLGRPALVLRAESCGAVVSVGILVIVIQTPAALVGAAFASLAAYMVTMTMQLLLVTNRGAQQLRNFMLIERTDFSALMAMIRLEVSTCREV